MGTVVVPAAPVGARGIVYVTGKTFCGLIGAGGAGQVPVPGGGRLQVVVTGLAPNNVYRAVFNYTLYERGTAPPATASLIPASSFSLITAKTATFDFGPTARVAVYTKTADLVQTGDLLEFLVKDTVTTPTTSWLVTVLNLPKVYSAFAITVATTGGVHIPYCVSVIDLTLAFAHGGAPTFCAPFRKNPSTTAAQWLAIVPFGNEIGDNVEINIRWSSAPTRGTVQVYGLTNNPSVPARADGRVPPTGQLTSVNFSTSLGTGTLITAPANPLRIMLKSLVMAANSAVGHALVDCTINGTTGTLLATTGGPAALTWESGLLCDPATPVLHSAAQAGFHFASAVYDIML